MVAFEWVSNPNEIQFATLVNKITLRLSTPLSKLGHFPYVQFVNVVPTIFIEVQTVKEILCQKSDLASNIIFGLKWGRGGQMSFGVFQKIHPNLGTEASLN